MARNADKTNIALRDLEEGLKVSGGKNARAVVDVLRLLHERLIDLERASGTPDAFIVDDGPSRLT